MAETKRSGWLARMFGADKTEAPAPELPLAPAAAPGVQALDVLFGAPGSNPASGLDGEPDGSPRAAPAPVPAPSASVPVQPAQAAAEPGPAPLIVAEGVRPVDLTALADAATQALAVDLRITVHVSNRGDMQAGLDNWAGERGSGESIEGLAVVPIDGIDPDDLEYQAMLDDGTLTTWHRGQTYCGTRGEWRALRGFALRLAGPALATFSVTYAAVFRDGSEVGPVGDGAICAAPSGAPLEALYVMIDPV